MENKQTETVAIVLNAPFLDVEITEEKIICADGGYGLLGGRTPYAVVGDFDSLTSPPVGTIIKKCPAEKNFTDGEFAVRTAIDLGFKKIVIYGATGGRPDHEFCNFALLPLAKKLGLDAAIKGKGFTVTYRDAPYRGSLPIGTTVSILPFGGSASVSHSEGLFYHLENLILTTHDTRGISNVTTAPEYFVDIVSGGVLLFEFD